MEEGFQIGMVGEFQVVHTPACYNGSNQSQVPTVMSSNTSLTAGKMQGIGDEFSRLYHAKG